MPTLFSEHENLGIRRIPRGYVHGKALDIFREKVGKVWGVDEKITDANFKSSFALKAGQKFLVKIYKCQGDVSLGDCFSLMRRVGAISAGSRGIPIMLRGMKDIPFGYYASLDQRELINEITFKRTFMERSGGKKTQYIKDITRIQVPIFKAEPDKVSFELDIVSGIWFRYLYLVCFIPVK